MHYQRYCFTEGKGVNTQLPATPLHLHIFSWCALNFYGQLQALFKNILRIRNYAENCTKQMKVSKQKLLVGSCPNGTGFGASTDQLQVHIEGARHHPIFNFIVELNAALPAYTWHLSVAAPHPSEKSWICPWAASPSGQMQSHITLQYSQLHWKQHPREMWLGCLREGASNRHHIKVIIICTSLVEEC